MTPIPNHPGYYATIDGNIYRLKKDGKYRQLKALACTRINSDGTPYIHRLYVGLYKDGIPKKRTVAQLILETFVGPKPAGLVARHVNDIPYDNRLENLRWGTTADNFSDMLRNYRFYKDFWIKYHDEIDIG
jgi:hypothetical protein